MKKKPQQLDCQLYCKAAAELVDSIKQDLTQEDGNLEKLLGEDKNEDQTTQGDTNSSS